MERCYCFSFSFVFSKSLELSKAWFGVKVFRILYRYSVLQGSLWFRTRKSREVENWNGTIFSTKSWKFLIIRYKLFESYGWVREFICLIRGCLTAGEESREFHWQWHQNIRCRWRGLGDIGRLFKLYVRECIINSLFVEHDFEKHIVFLCRLVPIKLKDRNFGNELENGSYDGLLGLIQSNQSQIIPRSGVFRGRLSLVDYTIPLWNIRYSWFRKKFRIIFNRNKAINNSS